LELIHATPPTQPENTSASDTDSGQRLADAAGEKLPCPPQARRIPPWPLWSWAGRGLLWGIRGLGDQAAEHDDSGPGRRVNQGGDVRGVPFTRAFVVRLWGDAECDGPKGLARRAYADGYRRALSSPVWLGTSFPLRWSTGKSNGLCEGANAKARTITKASYGFGCASSLIACICLCCTVSPWSQRTHYRT
jgi:hypothetical protein